MNVNHILKMHEGSELLNPVLNNITKRTKGKTKDMQPVSESTQTAIIDAITNKRGCTKGDMEEVTGFTTGHLTRCLRWMAERKLIKFAMLNEDGIYGTYTYYLISDPIEILDKKTENRKDVLAFVDGKGKVKNPEIIKALKHITAHSIKNALNSLVESCEIKKYHAGRSGNKTIWGYSSLV